jgi:hypothetical protein
VHNLAVQNSVFPRVLQIVGVILGGCFIAFVRRIHELAEQH